MPAATRIRHLSPTPDFLGPWSGKQPTELVPAAHVIDWLQDARRRILAAGGTDQEANSLMVAGGSVLALTYTDDLTEIEQARDTLAGLTTLADMAQKFRNAKGESTVSTEDFNAFLDRLLALAEQKAFTPSGDTPGSKGTQGPAAPPATPNTPTPPAPAPTDEQRRDLFRTIASVGGWDLKTQARDALNYARQKGMPDLTAAEVERWEGLAAGALEG